ncbi:metal-independent alpha-mannosidase [Mucilaginibacter sp. PPCGB 2223]|uniref:glycoside hydrolase family 125 protein n=1 Tax=Mucilaginibacter sp. PPCGB 2223 TaxID=1886027 RepID=UPI0008245A9D|nr:glycoside hydrolase family 125 protein [Mucilaginibacter sp. PPCGB 2223]OCX54431.1 metal-independent alpha-mannosidase [Mucilaginibacter sp. PPCGB 2223]
MKRSQFLQHTSLLATGLFLSNNVFAINDGEYPGNRPLLSKRNFRSAIIEDAIVKFKAGVKNKELGWLFENCFPNTLDTTVFFEMADGKPDTYVITGDIDAMWLRDSSAQVWPYLPFTKTDDKLKKLIAGVINRQTRCILKDPYANAFYKDDTKISEWKSDHTEMKPGVHERKYEIDSLCYPIRLAYHYWKTTGDTQPFDEQWKHAIHNILQVFIDQQRKTGHGPYHFQRSTSAATDTLPMGGYGFPVKPVGLICSMFRPSDDATIYPFLVPSNFFAVVSLRQAAEMVSTLQHDTSLATQLQALAIEVEVALRKYAIVSHPVYGQIYAYEVDGFGNHNLMDDANIPGLLALPYLGAVNINDPVYQNTRRYVLSDSNPYFSKGKFAEGISGPHVGMPDMAWPLSIISRGLTSTSDDEIKYCIDMLRKTHAGTGFMHEAFNVNDPTRYTRKWFAWANTIFGEFLWNTYQEKPHLLID